MKGLLFVEPSLVYKKIKLVKWNVQPGSFDVFINTVELGFIMGIKSFLPSIFLKTKFVCNKMFCLMNKLVHYQSFFPYKMMFYANMMYHQQKPIFEINKSRPHSIIDSYSSYWWTSNTLLEFEQYKILFNCKIKFATGIPIPRKKNYAKKINNNWIQFVLHVPFVQESIIFSPQNK